MPFVDAMMSNSFGGPGLGDMKKSNWIGQVHQVMIKRGISIRRASREIGLSRHYIAGAFHGRWYIPNLLTRLKGLPKHV
jgi:hypothetical protein